MEHHVFFTAKDLNDKEKMKIKVYFQLTRKSGGGDCGDVENVAENVYKISFLKKKVRQRVLDTKEHEIVLLDGENLHISLSPDLKDLYSRAQGHLIREGLPPPGQIQVTSVSSDSVCLSWGAPEGLAGDQIFRIKWRQGGKQHTLDVPGVEMTFQGLSPGEEYEFSVATISDGDRDQQSPCVSAKVLTEIPQPQHLHVDVGSASASLSWSKPAGVEDISYLVTVFRGGKWEKTITTCSHQCSLAELEPDVENVISVSTVLSSGQQSEPVTKTICAEQNPSLQSHKKRFLDDLISRSVLIPSECPKLYQLPMERQVLDEEGTVRRWSFGKQDHHKTNRTIIMVGETGSGKTTLINTLVNHVLGVKLEDRVWFQITENQAGVHHAEAKEDQTVSQTKSITIYDVFLEEHKTSFTVIDTPGYGDTRGLQYDQLISQNLQTLFRLKNGVHDIDAVCLVVKASQNRLTEFQRYVFDAVLSLFGKDVEKNTVVMITHSDGMPPQNALDAINKAKVACARNKDQVPVHFLFNNRQPDQVRLVEKNEQMYRLAWERGMESIATFETFLSTVEKRSVNMTKGVLRERMRLEAAVQNIKEKISWIEMKLRSLEQTQRAVELKNVTFEVEEMYKEKVPIGNPGWFSGQATCCTVCEENCHYPGCWWVANLSWCEVMSDNYCTVCTNKCHHSKHVKEGKMYITKTRRVRKTKEDLKREYEQKYGQQVDILSKVKQELETEVAEKSRLVEEAYQAIMTLEQIALKKAANCTLLHLDFLLERLVEAGSMEKVKKLKELRITYMAWGSSEKQKSSR
ncbi:uncharacterized protein LOC114790172 [Denticeps clupeoides]|uniref:Fibronectin type-III domain-containing protein n=1 Tax=Denticeps clupeoides TaxID=299321 RepID=A0AAY4A0W3_9TELE|nr:uncharacterized protein LOC114790172 [Denticeps clupeoides]